MWREFDDLAHTGIALWRRCRVSVGKTEGGGTVYDVNDTRLRNYIDADGPLVYGYEAQDLIDAVLVVNRVKSGG